MPCRDCNAPAVAARGFCKPCYYRHRRLGTLLQHATKKRPLEDRFMDFFNRIVPTEKGCMEWPGARQGGTHNYGIITTEFKGKGYSQHHRAHRISYQVHKGPIPKGMDICHTCDNPPCVNPLHLFPGTNARNIEDCIEKDRHARGMRNGHAKFTDEEIYEIRNSQETSTALAKRFGVHQPAISRIRSRERWKHLK